MGEPVDRARKRDRRLRAHRHQCLLPRGGADRGHELPRVQHDPDGERARGDQHEGQPRGRREPRTGQIRRRVAADGEAPEPR